MAAMPFDGLRVLSLESRRAPEMEVLIRKQGGDAFVAPSMREVPLEHNDAAFAFAERLFAGGIDLMVLLTGVGTRQLDRLLATRYPAEAFADALRRIPVVVRGPKPAAVLRDMNVPYAAIAPEPNTWRELLGVMEGRTERHVAVQEYGRSNDDLLAALRARGAEVSSVRVYQWDLPEDTGPLREAARRLAAGAFDVVMFTTAIQVPHLFRVARELGIETEVAAAFARVAIASIGPTTSEALDEFGLHADLEPSHPKMGFLVQETAQRAGDILRARRA
jgi:uroporphyrinogen-III synthase